MEVRQRGLMAALLMASLVVAPMAEAKRAGGGKSHGMSRSVAPSQSSQPRQAAPAQPPNTAPARKGPGVGGMVAAGVAGAAIGAVAANALADDNTPASNAQATEQQQEEKGGIPNWIWILLLAAGAFFLFRKFGAKKKLAANNPYAPNNAGNTAPFGQPTAAPRTSNDNSNIFGQSVGGTAGAAPQAPFGSASTSNGNQLPDGSEPAAFLRVARQRFNHIQSMNTASNINEIQRYLTPELYQSMHSDIMANQDQDVAEFSNLNAMVTNSANENGQYVVSVRFTGTVSEDLNSPAQAFAEVWHFTKPAGSNQEWLVAGIQQEA
ncbi:MAG: Tim44 domain-containing protein [Acinetobacter sp.]|uniref:Tim44 domain-containing protein n=1 Tax=Acinetobacter sp. TaxID=472 RepID=UPI002579C2B5|nr:Tim44-like domain-containing protein [Acinetobacter sp.]MBR5558349.1 Tim44 domain-containing protein [Acinetobacter sp.]